MVTYYGHGSWIAVVVLFGLFAMRALSSQRRRRGRSRTPAPTSSFTGTASHGSGSGKVWTYDSTAGGIQP